MTVQELFEETKALGFATEIEDTDAFYFCANRALLSLYTDCPEVRTALYEHRPPTPTEHYPRLCHRGGTETPVPLTGRYYCFRVCGSGRFGPLHGGRTVEFGEGGVFRGALSEGGLLFAGEEDYTVLDLCAYQSKSSGTIPLPSEECILRGTMLGDDFLSFCRLPETEEGRPIVGARMTPDTITLPPGVQGRLRLYYRRRPRPLCRGAEDPGVDVPVALCHLLPLLTAAYLWLDDEPGKAQYYMSVYRDALATFLQGSGPAATGGYRADNGWA